MIKNHINDFILKTKMKVPKRIFINSHEQTEFSSSFNISNILLIFF